jgi:hypothetical protein
MAEAAANPSTNSDTLDTRREDSSVSADMLGNEAARRDMLDKDATEQDTLDDIAALVALLTEAH